MKLHQLNLTSMCEIAVWSKLFFPDIKQQRGLLASLVCFPCSGSAVFNDLLFQAEWIGQILVEHPNKLTQIKLVRFIVPKLIAELIFDDLQ